MAVRNLPRDPPGEGGDGQDKIRHHFEHFQDDHRRTRKRKENKNTLGPWADLASMAFYQRAELSPGYTRENL